MEPGGFEPPTFWLPGFSYKSDWLISFWKYKNLPLLNMTDCSLAQRANPFLQVAHISTPAFLLTDLLTNCAGRGVTGRYETPWLYPALDTKWGHATPENTGRHGPMRFTKSLLYHWARLVKIAASSTEYPGDFHHSTKSLLLTRPVIEPVFAIFSKYQR